MFVLSVLLQDPQNMSMTVIVIRSLVPGGVADRDRRVFPGDRLVYVSAIYSNLSETQAKQIFSLC